jgi:hypothetical protein
MPVISLKVTTRTAKAITALGLLKRLLDAETCIAYRKLSMEPY